MDHATPEERRRAVFRRAHALRHSLDVTPVWDAVLEGCEIGAEKAALSAGDVSQPPGLLTSLRAVLDSTEFFTARESGAMGSPSEYFRYFGPGDGYGGSPRRALMEECLAMALERAGADAAERAQHAAFLDLILTRTVADGYVRDLVRPFLADGEYSVLPEMAPTFWIRRLVRPSGGPRRVTGTRLRIPRPSLAEVLGFRDRITSQLVTAAVALVGLERGELMVSAYTSVLSLRAAGARHVRETVTDLLETIIAGDIAAVAEELYEIVVQCPDMLPRLDQLVWTPSPGHRAQIEERLQREAAASRARQRAERSRAADEALTWSMSPEAQAAALSLTDTLLYHPELDCFVTIEGPTQTAYPVPLRRDDRGRPTATEIRPCPGVLCVLRTRDGDSMPVISRRTLPGGRVLDLLRSGCLVGIGPLTADNLTHERLPEYVTRTSRGRYGASVLGEMGSTDLLTL